MDAKRATVGIPKGSRTASYWIAWSLCASTLALILCAVALSFLNRYALWELLFLIAEATGALVGGLIASRRPYNPVGWFIVGHALCFSLGEFARQYAIYGLLTKPGALPLAGAVASLAYWVWYPGLILVLALLPLYFPDGRLVSRRWRPVAWLAVLAVAIASVFAAIVPGDVETPGLPNPLGIEGLRPFVGTIDAVVMTLLLGVGLASVASMVVRYRRTGGEERQQIKWFVYAVVLNVFAFPVSNLFLYALSPVASSVLHPIFLGSLWVAIAFAILKYRLYDIDLIINRTLVYGALSACVVGIYVLVIGYLGALFRVEGNLLISLVATGLVAVLFQPLRERLQRAVNRLMYGERDDPYAVLSRLGERLEVTLAPGAILPAVVQTVREALRLPYAAIALKEGEEHTTAAESGSTTNEPLRLPLVYQGEEVGALLLAPRPGEGDFSPADRRLLDDLARQASVAAHAVRLTADLQRSRERLVAAREEERRRLRRDLHDGLGPTLGSLPLKLDVAGDLLESDPAAARALLRGLKEQAQGAVTDIRRLVYELRPPALDDLGLVGAIREISAQHGTNGLRISLESPGIMPPLPAAVEAAAYRIAQEATTNVVRHAGASECIVRLALDGDGVLRLEIEDDGRGLSTAHARGVGIASMRERAEELGGSCVVESPPTGGTCVHASLPCAVPHPEQEEE